MDIVAYSFDGREGAFEVRRRYSTLLWRVTINDVPDDAVFNTAQEAVARLAITYGVPEDLAEWSAESADWRDEGMCPPLARQIDWWTSGSRHR